MCIFSLLYRSTRATRAPHIAFFPPAIFSAGCTHCRAARWLTWLRGGAHTFCLYAIVLSGLRRAGRPSVGVAGRVTLVALYNSTTSVHAKNATSTAADIMCPGSTTTTFHQRKSKLHVHFHEHSRAGAKTCSHDRANRVVKSYEARFRYTRRTRRASSVSTICLLQRCTAPR